MVHAGNQLLGFQILRIGGKTNKIRKENRHLLIALGLYLSVILELLCSLFREDVEQKVV